MTRYTLTILTALLWGITLQPDASPCLESKSPPVSKDLLSVNFSKTDLDLSLLGTVTKEGFGTAVLKNLSSGKLKTYVQGDLIDLVEEDEVRLVGISNCAVMIYRQGRYETLSCRSVELPEHGQTREASEALYYRLVSPLARYKIVGRSKESNKASHNIKSAYEEEIINASRKHRIDPYLVKAVIKAESNFNPFAVSPKRAMGMMQLIPETAKDYGVDNPFDPEENIDGGIRFLKHLLEYFDGDFTLALAAYNAGKGAVIKYGFKVPPYSETIAYVDRVLGYYNLMKWNPHEPGR